MAGLLLTFMALWAVGDFKGVRQTPVIYGGDRIDIEDAPFIALYIYTLKNLHYCCSASILSENFILSAAHCYKVDNHFVMVGTDNVNEGQKYEIEKTVVHPNYNIDLDYDVLVLKLQYELLFSEKVQPIKMADTNFIFREEMYFTLYGFGRTETNSSEYLHGVRVPLVNHDVCSYYHRELTDTMICAGEKGRGGCLGDSGGPLVYEDMVVGVVSYGNRPCEQGPTVLVNVLRVRSFIDYVMSSYQT